MHACVSRSFSNLRSCQQAPVTSDTTSRRRQEQKQELGDKDVYVGDISQPDTLHEAMQDSDKLVM